MKLFEVLLKDLTERRKHVIDNKLPWDDRDDYSSGEIAAYSIVIEMITMVLRVDKLNKKQLKG